MSGTPYQLFNDYMLGTDPTYVTGPEEVGNLAQKHRTYWLNKMLSGEAPVKYIQGGDSIEGAANFRAGKSEFVHPEATWTYEGTDGTKAFKIAWRIQRSHMKWNKFEIETNGGISSAGSTEARERAFFRVSYTKEQAMWTGKFDLMEDSMWTAPTQSEMENPQGLAPNSIPHFCNGYTNGLFGSDLAGYDAPTTVETLDPTAEYAEGGKWTPTVSKYTDTGDEYMLAFDRMWLKLDWEPVQTKEQFYSSPMLRKVCVGTNLAGVTTHQSQLRTTHDSWVFVDRKAQEGSVPNPASYGAAIRYVAALDDAALYDDGANGLATDENAAIVGPRYYFVNTDSLYPVFHSEVFCQKQPLVIPTNQPDVRVLPVFTYWNLMCNSVREQGFLEPSVSSFAGNYE